MFIGGLILAGLGLLMSLIGLVDGITSIRLWRSGVQVTGQVVGSYTVPGDSKTVHTKVGFKTTAGKSVEFQSGETFQPSDMGQPREVRYLPSNPEIANLAHRASFKGVLNQLGITLIGAMFVVGGLALAFFRTILDHWVHS